MANMETYIDQLTLAWKVLFQQYEGTKPVWDDIVRQRFEENYLTTIEGQTQVTLKEMQRLAQTIAEARHRIR